MPTTYPIRLATTSDIPALAALIELSVRELLSLHYPPPVIEASLGPAFGVDPQLIRDRTYFVIEHEGAPIACGGWSYRAKSYGGDHRGTGILPVGPSGVPPDLRPADSHSHPYTSPPPTGEESPLLDPTRDPARIRAFFVHPQWTRRGLGRALLAASESAARAAGFTRAIMVATLAGEKLYAAHGYTAQERYDAPLPGGHLLTVINMTKDL